MVDAILETTPATTAGFTALSRWIEGIGTTPTTAWRWRSKGWLETVNICGRVYVTDEGARKFLRRAEAGEFASEHLTPGRVRQLKKSTKTKRAA